MLREGLNSTYTCTWNQFPLCKQSRTCKVHFKADQSCKTKPHCSSCIIEPWTFIQQNNCSTVNSFIGVLPSTIGGLCFKTESRKMEFLDINLTKYSFLLFYTIHNLFNLGILKKTILFCGLKLFQKKSAKQENSSLFMNSIL